MILLARDLLSPLAYLSLVPAYASAEKPAPADQPDVILSQNELAFPPSPKAVAAATEAGFGANRYPESDCTALCAAIAATHGLDAARILCTPGSMMLLGALVRSYAGPGDEVILTQHGYAYFRTVVQLAGAQEVIAPEAALTADVDAILACISDKTRIILLANPNNPTGTLLPWSEILRLHSAAPPHILLVLDAAYAEFVEDPDYQAGGALVDKSANVAMIRTFSKIYGLAGMRVGWGYFPAGIADMLRRILPPSGVSSQAQAAAVAALADAEYTTRIFDTVTQERRSLSAALADLGLAPVASQANFLLADFGSAARAKAAYDWLAQRQIYLRPVGSAGLTQHLRITIGTAEEHARLIRGLAEFTNSHPAPFTLSETP